MKTEKSLNVKYEKLKNFQETISLYFYQNSQVTTNATPTKIFFVWHERPVMSFQLYDFTFLQIYRLSGKELMKNHRK